MTITSINVAADQWGTLISRFNEAIDVLNNESVKVNATANGAAITGNVFIVGTIGATEVAAGTLRGGNVQASAVLPISSNVSVGNSTVNTRIGYGNLVIGNVAANMTHLSVGALLVMNTTAIVLGGNVAVTTSGVSIGNSTVNTTANSIHLSVDTASLDGSSLRVGNSTVNAVINSISVTIGGTVANTTALVVTGSVRVGNSTVNAVVNSTAITMSGANYTTYFIANNDARVLNAGRLDTEDQTLTGGAAVTSKSLGTVSSGTLTPDPGDRPLQHYTANGAHTLAPGSTTGSYLLDITNGASAGAITTSGWTKVAGDAFTTTNGHKFRCHCSVGNGGSLLIVQALQ